MRIRRLVATMGALLIIATGLLAAPSAAAATEQSPATVAYSQTRGCNGWVCVNVIGSGTYVQRVYVDKVSWAPVYRGHYDILVPVPPYRYNGPTQDSDRSFSKTLNKYMPNNSKICGEGWQYSGGRYILRGRPCLTIHS